MNKPILPLLALLALALPAHAEWTYTEGAGKQNNQPYSGIISDGNWEIRVYRPDASSDDFWLGCGGSGSGARVAGSGALDLTDVLADTTAAGTPVRLVNVAPVAFRSVGNSITGLVLPNTVTNIGNAAFENCKNTSVDLRNTQIRTIQGFAFAWNQSLAEVWLPETLEYVGKCGFCTMPDSVVFHFAGDVPRLGPPTDPNTGTQYAYYISSTEYGNFSNGSTLRWAFCVNAEKYPNWTRIGRATYYDEDDPFPSGEASWIPQSVRYTSNADYAAPFGNTWFGRSTDASKLASQRTYLIQEGTWSGAAVARPMFGEPVVDAKRNAVTNTIPLYVGSSPPVTVTYTFGSETRTLTATADTNLVFGVDGLPDSTAYAWSIAATAATGSDSAAGTATTLTPDVVLGEPSYEITKDGRIATVFIPVTSLLSESALLEFVLDNRVVFATNATAVGTYSYTAADLELGRTYAFTIYGTAGADEDMKTISFVAERYKWTYAEGAGTVGGKPFTGTITDKNWTLRVYRPDSASDAFWIGCGNGGGASAVVAGSGELDLTQVLDDTTGDGTPVRIVEIARSAFKVQGGLTSFVAPETVTNVANFAFEGIESGLASADFSKSRLKAVGGCAFAWCKDLVEVRFPKTLRKVGACAFTVIHDKCVFRFAGPPPELVDNAGDKEGSKYAAYLNSNAGEYRNFNRGADNAQLAFCIDNKMFPAWNDLSGTTWYTPPAGDNPFPSGEASWIPESVRYTVNEAYKAPLGTTTFGRSSDTSANGRTYLIFEKHGDACTMLLIF